jgi:hypothetical protein
MHSLRPSSRRSTHRERRRASRPTHRHRRSLRHPIAPAATLLALCAVVAVGLLPGPADAGSGRLEGVRDAVVHGTARDFAQGTGVVTPSAEDRPRSAGPNGAAAVKLGVTYGPYLGKRCRDIAYPRCELIDVDVVFGRAATRVEAIAGAQRIRLRTPGKHSGARRHDWVGTFTATGLARTHDSANRSGELLYVPVEIRVRFADGRRAHAVFPHVLVAPGWG